MPKKWTGAAGRLASALLVLSIALGLAATASPRANAAGNGEKDRYVVLLKDSVERPGSVARAEVTRAGGRLGFVYRHAVNGFSASLPVAAVAGLRADPRVLVVAPDHEMEAFAQSIPTGIDRIFATGNKNLDIDGTDDKRVDVDVAVIDGGVDQTHPDLNVTKRTDCSNGTEAEAKCVENSGVGGLHGTHVAGTIAAIDNGEGVVGVAPGARIWSVKVFGENAAYESEVVAAVDWLTAHADEVEVANMSLGCPCSVPVLDAAIAGSVDAGIVYVVAAGNKDWDASNTSPAKHPDVITVSGVADYNGKSGGGASPTCQSSGADDTSYDESNWGNLIEIAAPAVCILSTAPGNQYVSLTGTSMASPHVAGAAAILASTANPNSQADVEAIRNTIVAEGNLNWTDTSGDGKKEPLLDVTDESVFGAGKVEPKAPSATTNAATGISSSGATLRGTVNPNGAETTYQFEYGTTTSYGTKVPVSPKAIGSGVANVEVSEAASGLSPNTTYHFRVVATNSKGTTNGADQQFTTLQSVEWKIESTPNPSSASGSEQRFVDVNCFSGSWCMGVGAYSNSEKSGALAEHWDGTSWSILTTTSGATFNDVHCLSGTECAAVGSKEGKVWAERWNKTQGWVTMTPPTVEGTSSVLNSGTCAPFKVKYDCLAVGSHTVSGEERPLAMRWDIPTQKWTVHTTPTKGEDGVLTAISCNEVSSCIAVGYYVEAGDKHPLAMHWNGTTWSLKTAPDGEGEGKDTYLNDVSCLGEAGSATRCIAVGVNEGGAAQVPVSKYWNGVEWSEISPKQPSDAKGDIALHGVSCASTTECFAVGEYDSALEKTESKTLTQKWNGSAWSISGSPNREGYAWNGLRGVSCGAAFKCVGVGFSKNATRTDTLAMRRE